MNKLAILFAFTFYLGLHSYLFIRMTQALPPQGPFRAIFAVLFIFSALAFPLGMLLGGKLPLGIVTVMENVGAYWMIGLLYMSLAVFFADVIRLSNHFFHFYPDWIVANYQQVKFYYLIFVLVLFTGFSLVGNYRFRHTAVRELTIEIPKGDGPAGELTLVAATDVHLGTIIRKNRLRKFVNLINEQKPDIILFGGDLIDHSMRPVLAQRMDEELRDLRATYGVYGVFGNHEYYGNVKQAAEFYTQAGITLLTDTAVTVADRLVLAGRNDISQRHRKPLEEIVSGFNQKLPRILLDHNPARLTDAENNQIDLQISGHTHNGQIFPLNYLVKRMYPLAYGYHKSGKTHYYVSSGLGLWAAPVRIGTRSEIAKIRVMLR